MKKLLRVLAAALVFCLLLTLVKNEYGRILTRHASSGLEALAAAYGADAEEPGQKGDGEKNVCLFVGSSMFRQGLDVRVLEEALGPEIYLLTYNGTQPFLMYEELCYLLDRGVKISSLFLDMFPNGTWNDPWVQDEKTFLDTDLRFKTSLWRGMKNSDGAGFSAFWEMFVTANNERLLTWPIDYGLTNGMFYKGGNLLTNTGTTEEALMAQKGDPDLPGFMNETQALYIEKILALCAEEGIPVCYIETPKYYHVMDERAYQDVMERFAGILEEHGVPYLVTEATMEHLSRDRGLAVQHGRSYAFDSHAADCYIDVIHLSSKGRTIFTGTIAGPVAERIAECAEEGGK